MFAVRFVPPFSRNSPLNTPMTEIKDVGTIPFELIADVLPLMSPEQLLHIESASPVSFPPLATVQINDLTGPKASRQGHQHHLAIQNLPSLPPIHLTLLRPPILKLETGLFQSNPSRAKTYAASDQTSQRSLSSYRRS